MELRFLSHLNNWRKEPVYELLKEAVHKAEDIIDVTVSYRRNKLGLFLQNKINNVQTYVY